MRFGDAVFHRKPAEAAWSSEEAGPPLLPALSEALYLRGGTLPQPPTLPEWVPLPAWPSGAAEERPPWASVESRVMRGDLEGAEGPVDHMASAPERSATRLRYARALLVCGDAGRARRMVDLCIDEEPLLLEAFLLKAGFREDEGDLTGAEQAYRRALCVDRACAMAHFRLGLIRRQRGDVAGALERLRSELEAGATRDGLPSDALEGDIRRARLLPLAMLADWFRRSVRDLAQESGKSIRYEADVGDVLLDKAIIEALKDPLLHLIRNAVDHGIETPAERRAAGKPEEGAVRVRAARRGNRVRL